MPRVALAALTLLAGLACPAHAQQAAAPPPAPVLAIVPSSSAGVDPIVGRFVDRALQRAAQARGYAPVLDAPPASGAAPSMATLWNRMHLLGGEHALHASVRARDGLYVVALAIASRDGSGPRKGEVQGGQRDLEAAVAAWVEQTLPAPRGVSEPVSAAAPAPAVPVAAAAAAEPARVPEAPRAARTPATPVAPAREAPPPEPPSWRLSLRDELVLGLGEDDFIGVLVGGGADYRIDDALWLGLRLVYANLPGREERAQASLWYAQLEHLTHLGGRVSLPLRLGLGYLAANGSVLRLTSGLAIDAGRGVGLQLDLLAPTFWVTPDRTLFSISLGIEASASF